jgi:hypothetical protein
MERNIMESIRILTNQLDAAITQVWDHYIDLHKELDTHRGKPIDDTNLPEVNRLLGEIQNTFSQLYPAFHFIAIRHEYVSNAVTFYNDFIETIKKSGATEYEPQQQ